MSEYSHLPATYYVAESNEQVKEPAYRLLAPHFFDNTYWTEGDIIVTNLEPTLHLEPLNRAAGKAMEAYLDSLPQDGKDLSLGDLTEAAMMLRPREGEPELSNDAFQAAVLKMAAGLKAKRQGKEPVVPRTSNVRPAAQKAPAPLANARFADAAQAQVARQVQFQGDAPEKHVRKPVPQAGNMPAGVRESV